MHLDLSMTTVSRALNGYPEVSEETRKRVVEAAEALGYTPNPVARRLASGKAQAVGLVLPLPEGAFGDPRFAELLAGIGERLQDEDIDLIVTAPPIEREMGAYHRIVDGGRADALIIAQTRRDDERIRFLLDRGFPFIAYGQTELDAPYACFDMDNVECFRLATKRLLDLGHRRIALINDRECLNFASLRRRGFETALSEAGIAPDPELMVQTGTTEPDGERKAARLLSLADPPSGLICSEVHVAMGAMKAIAARGLTVGHDISVIAYDDLQLGPGLDPPLTTYSQPIRPVGVRLAEMVLQLMAGRPAAEVNEMWVASLVPGRSDGPPPAGGRPALGPDAAAE